MWCEIQLVSVPELALVSLLVQVEQPQRAFEVPKGHGEAISKTSYICIIWV